MKVDTIRFDVDVRANHEMVTIEGTYLGASLSSRTFDDVTRHEGIINLIIPESPSEKKTLEIKFKDVNKLSDIQAMFNFGDKFKARCLANAYQNKITYRLYEILPSPVSVGAK